MRVEDIDTLFPEMWPKLVGFFHLQKAPDPENMAAAVFLRVVKANPPEVNAGYVWRAARMSLVDSYRRASARPHECALKEADAVPYGVGIAGLLDLQAALREITPAQRDAILGRAAGYQDKEMGDADSIKHLRLRGAAHVRRLVA